jgi:LysM repeat protein
MKRIVETNPYIVNHKLRKGETLPMLASVYLTSVERILKLNPNITKPNLIYPNQIIKVPDNR